MHHFAFLQFSRLQKGVAARQKPAGSAAGNAGFNSLQDIEQDQEEEVSKSWSSETEAARAVRRAEDEEAAATARHFDNIR